MKPETLLGVHFVLKVGAEGPKDLSCYLQKGSSKGLQGYAGFPGLWGVGSRGHSI